MSDTNEPKWAPAKTAWTPSAGAGSWSPSSADPADAGAGSDEANKAAELARIKLEERKVRLDETRERHRMSMELRKQDFLEMQINRDWDLENKGKENKKEHWVKSFWRPAAGWLYMGICFMDFVGFPIIYTFLPLINRAFGITMNFVAWQSLTLSNGGLFHLAFGAILGVAAWSRGQEKMSTTPGQSSAGFGGSASGFGGSTSGSAAGGFGSGSGSGFGR